MPNHVVRIPESQQNQVQRLFLSMPGESITCLTMQRFYIISERFLDALKNEGIPFAPTTWEELRKVQKEEAEIPREQRLAMAHETIKRMKERTNGKRSAV